MKEGRDEGLGQKVNGAGAMVVDIFNYTFDLFSITLQIISSNFSLICFFIFRFSNYSFFQLIIF